MENNEVYFGDFENLENMLSQFDIPEKEKVEIRKLNIIYAHYNGGYSGEAFVLFKKDGKLYEVNASHCSCHGLKDWEPEETTKEALLKRTWINDLPHLKSIIETL